MTGRDPHLDGNHQEQRPNDFGAVPNLDGEAEEARCFADGAGCGFEEGDGEDEECFGGCGLLRSDEDQFWVAVHARST